jgi:hypothetical protein
VELREEYREPHSLVPGIATLRRKIPLAVGIVAGDILVRARGVSEDVLPGFDGAHVEMT